jgi:phospholipid/cholesterol/gamma-HCH transport system substrate-binding protein
MKSSAAHRRIHPGWWTVVLIVVVISFVWVCSAMFTGTLTSFVRVTLASDRAGLVMESGAKVKLRGVQVGRVATIEGGAQPIRLTLQLFPDEIKHIPANVAAAIRATTIFGAKYVDLIYPDHPSAKHISAGGVIWSRNVSIEVNTVFENLVSVLHQIDPPKLNAVLTAIADAVRGRGEQMGEAITASNHVLAAINPRMDVLQQDWRSLAGLGDAYSGAAQNILNILDNASTTSATITAQSAALNSVLLSTIGFSEAGTELLGPNKDNFAEAINSLLPTTDLLSKYSPEYACTLVGAKNWLDSSGYQMVGGDGRTIILDDAFLFGEDLYRYPDNLAIVAAKGGPGGKPGCGALPDASKSFPVPHLVTNTGWGDGLDLRPNPGIGFPGWLNFWPVTRGTPEPPVIRNIAPPAPGPAPVYPGGPPYGAPFYGPDGEPLYPPPPPGAPPNAGPASGGPPEPSP